MREHHDERQGEREHQGTEAEVARQAERKKRGEEERYSFRIGTWNGGDRMREVSGLGWGSE